MSKEKEKEQHNKLLTFYVNFSKTLKKNGDINFELFKTSKFKPMQNSHVLQCNIPIPKIFFEDSFLVANLKVSNSHHANGDITISEGDVTIKDLVDELNRIKQED